MPKAREGESMRGGLVPFSLGGFWGPPPRFFLILSAFMCVFNGGFMRLGPDFSRFGHKDISNVGQNIPGQNIPCHFLPPRTKHPTSICHPGQNIPCSFCHPGHNIPCHFCRPGQNIPCYLCHPGQNIPHSV